MNAQQRKQGNRRLILQSLENRRLLAAGPYTPAAGVEGSDAISRTDPAIVGWASAVADYSPGSNVDAQWSNASEAIGPAEGEFNRIVSLGRGGTLTLTFNSPIRDGLGDDFAVFENSFSDTFLELGFVEVSSDGVNFHRFASDSLTTQAVGSFDTLDPTNLNNLAGKHRGGFGTPFDLGELSGRSGLDLTSVTHVRLVDIVGDGNTADATGDPIYDPTPTVGSAGLDVDGVGVLHAQATSEAVIDFETLGAALGGSLFDNGSDGSGGFTEQELSLNNNYNSTFQSWSGWSVSQSTDTTTAGFANQYSAFTGIGNQGSSTYAVGFFDSSPTGALPPPTLTLDPASSSQFDSFYVTNTTYAALSMRDGDRFAGPFGGVTGNDPDLLQLIVTGIDASGSSVGNVTVDLADYRFADNSQDFILDSWTKVDVSALTGARSLRFGMTSTDSNGFGMLTPAYFAIDDVTLLHPAVAFDLSTPVTSEDQGVTGRVSRASSDTSTPVVVTLERTGSDAASVPSSVTIPVGAAFSEFRIVPIDDGVPAPNRSLQITASADNLLPTTRDLLIEDDEVLGIALSSSVVDVNEGAGTITSLTLTRNDADISGPLTTTISGGSTSLLSVPTTVTFAANERTVTVPLSVLDDSQFNGNESVVVTASVPGRSPVSVTINIAEDDLPSLIVGPTSVLLDENSPTSTRTVTIGRNTADVSDPVTVTLSRLDVGPYNLPTSVTIPANSVGVDVNVTVIDDQLQNVLSSYRVQATSADFLSSVFTIGITDNDQASISIEARDSSGVVLTSVNEGSPFEVAVRRTATPLGESQVVGLSFQLDGQATDRVIGPKEVTIPAGANEAMVTLQVAIDDQVSSDAALNVTASADGFDSVLTSLVVADSSQPRLNILVAGDELLESNAATVVDFEVLGRGLLAGEFDNNAGDSGQFVSGPVALANSFDNSFGFDSWSGFTVSRGNDSSTPGFFNQYSAFPGIGSSQSDTYGVAFASSPTTITRTVDSPAFESFAITNTTYAALSMRDGDSFAKQFGGESGDDPDFFLLTIDGLDGDGNSLGTVEFYLADFRFDDNSLDYIVDQWTTIDLSSIGESVTLSMQLSSSDVGAFGMNTPGYFAIDDIALATADVAVPAITVQRVGDDLSEALTVSLVDDLNRLTLPGSVVIPAGQSSVDVPLEWTNDSIANTDLTWTVTANADGFDEANQQINLIDDDTASLTITADQDFIEESSGTQVIGFEDIGATLDSESFNNGADQRGGFSSGSAFFSTAFNPTFGSWSGWAASNVTDTTTAGFGNQFAAFAGSGADESDTFAVAGGFGASPPTIAVPASLDNASFDSISITNTTYAALSMLQGDRFAKQFGGETGDDPDFFLLTIEGFSDEGDSVGTTEFYLADYRFEDNTQDYVIDEWTTVDLTSLSDAGRLEFRLSSSDVGDFGMNTPAYFAIDQLQFNREAAGPSMTVHRNTEDLSEDLVVTLISDTPDRVAISSEVTIPSGADRVRVPLSVVDDAVYQSSESVVVTAVAPGLATASETFEIRNDELPRVLVEGSEENTALAETGVPVTLHVRLEAAPETETLVSIQGGEGHLEFEPSVLTFTPENWDQTQTLNVSSPADLMIEPDAVIPVQLVVNSGEFETGAAWVELTDYQPQSLSLTNVGGVIQLSDETLPLAFSQFGPQDDILIELSDADQELLLEPITGASGLIVVDAGGGSDTIYARTKDFTSIDGGDGEDTLVITPEDIGQDEVVNLADWLRHRVVRFETIVLGSADSSDNVSMRFALDSTELKEWFGDNPIRLITSANQVLNLSGNWQLGLPTLEDGVITGRLVGEGIEVSVSTQRPWQNFVNRADVNASGEVTAADALQVINRLNADPSNELPDPGSIDEVLGSFYDVSGDGLVTPTDALQIINILNETPATSEPIGLGESVLIAVEVSTEDDRTAGADDAVAGQAHDSVPIRTAGQTGFLVELSEASIDQDNSAIANQARVDEALADLELLSDFDPLHEASGDFLS